MINFSVGFSDPAEISDSNWAFDSAPPSGLQASTTQNAMLGVAVSGRKIHKSAQASRGYPRACTLNDDLTRWRVEGFGDAVPLKERHNVSNFSIRPTLQPFQLPQVEATLGTLSASRIAHWAAKKYLEDQSANNRLLSRSLLTENC